jgi:hypothetical protein
VLIGGAAKTERDDVLDLLAVRHKRMVERKREVLVEEDLQDAWCTAGGKCAATCSP